MTISELGLNTPKSFLTHTHIDLKSAGEVPRHIIDLTKLNGDNNYSNLSTLQLGSLVYYSELIKPTYERDFAYAESLTIQTVEDEERAKNIENLPTIGIEIEIPTIGFCAESYLDLVVNNLKFPKNDHNNPIELHYFPDKERYLYPNVIELSTSPSFGYKLQADIINNLFSVGLIPFFNSEYIEQKRLDDRELRSQFISDILIDQMIALHVNLGLPNLVNLDEVEYDLYMLNLIATTLYTSSQRLSYPDIAQVLDINKSSEEIKLDHSSRAELRTYELQNTHYDTELLKVIQLLALSIVSHRLIPNSQLGNIWTELESYSCDLFKINSNNPFPLMTAGNLLQMKMELSEEELVELSYAVNLAVDSVERINEL